ncbi:SpoIIE family protein phosphatase [Streptomyces sp. NPDC012461]|jgi:serine phosphatase RsbU (regulator of sigma subunit)|uniref:SpoIIE family protein phosphatase n=1 Tax=unclassified Streptomyces TaxID=2593676 RepID=UPI0033D338FC
MSEPVTPPEQGDVPGLAEMARVVARQRAELDRLHEQAATAAVVERAKGVVMALTGCSAEAAGDTLLRRSVTAGHSLLEECLLTLGASERSAPRSPEETPAAPEERPAAGPPGDGSDDGLGRLALALAHALTPQDVARCVLDHLSAGQAADSVVLYARRADGSLHLIGHAGLDSREAAPWRQLPPFNGLAPLDALRAGEPRWLEDFPQDSKRYLLIGEPPERWRSRAWLPVPGEEGADACVGVLRSGEQPFSPSDRAHLLEVARLCAGPLRTFTAAAQGTGAAPADPVGSLFEALPVAAMLLTPLRTSSGETEDFRIEAATAQAGGFLGGDGDPVGQRLRAYRPGVADEPLWQCCLTTLATGERHEGEPFAHEETVDGATELSTYSVRVTPLEDALVVIWVRHAPSDRQEQRLADLQRLGNLGWANWNLHTLEASWSAQAYAIVDRDPALEPVPLADLPQLALPEDRPTLSSAVRDMIGEGRPFDVLFRMRTAQGVRHLRLVAEALADAHGRPVDVHGFIQDLTARRRAELALVESEREILTQHDVLRTERALVARLQHALLPLPGHPVHPAGLRVEVAYLPAQANIHVGGDWFSAIELPDGDALFVVGDVAGHGVDAVATMAQLRFTAKGMVITGSSLTGALGRLNTLLLHSRDTRATATMVLARYRPSERRLVWAQAGHTPPLLLRDGGVTYLRRPPGMLLGAAPAPHFEEAECVLEPGDRLLLYTDGLVERPPENIDVGLERLAEAVARHPDEEPGSLHGLLETMLADDDRRDDVCVLDIRVPKQEE